MHCIVITPVGPGHQKLWEECKESVQRAIGYGRGPFTDVTHLKADDSLGQLGRSQARNDAVKRASARGADWLFFLDADDLLLADAFEAVQDYVQKHAAIWGSIAELKREETIPSPRPGQKTPTEFKDVLTLAPFLTLQMGHFVKAEVALHTPFDVTLDAAEDFDYYARVWRDYPGECIKIDRALFVNRRGNHSSGSRSASGGMWQQKVREVLGRYARELSITKQRNGAKRFDLGSSEMGEDGFVTVSPTGNPDIRAALVDTETYCPQDGVVEEFRLRHTLGQVPTSHYAEFLFHLRRKLKVGGRLTIIESDSEDALKLFSDGKLSFRAMRSVLFPCAEQLRKNSLSQRFQTWSQATLRRDLEAVGFEVSMFDAGVRSLEADDDLAPEEIESFIGTAVKNLGVIGTKLGIPRVIHQILKSGAPLSSETTESWEALDGFDYQRWDRDRIRALIDRDYPLLLPWFDACESDRVVNEVAKLLILHRHGGIVADSDTIPGENAAQHLEANDLLLAYPSQSEGSVATCLMGASREHPIFEESIARIEELEELPAQPTAIAELLAEVLKDSHHFAELLPADNLCPSWSDARDNTNWIERAKQTFPSALAVKWRQRNLGDGRQAKLVIAIRGHVRGVLETDEAGEFFAKLAEAFGARVVVSSWNKREAKSSWRKLEYSPSEVTAAMIENYFRRFLKERLSLVCLDDDETLEIIGEKEGKFAGIPRIAWKRQWAGNYRLMRLIGAYFTEGRREATDVRVLSIRMDYLSVTKNNAVPADDYLFDGVARLLRKQGRIVFHDDEKPHIGMDNAYVGDYEAMMKLAELFYFEQDAFEKRIPDIGAHQEYSLFHAAREVTA